MYSTSHRISCSRISRRAGQTRSGPVTSRMFGHARYETDKKTVRGTVFPSIGVYVAVILDLFSRRVVGWAISNRMKQDLAIRALNMAVALRRPPPGCIHHTDRGSQYCAHDYQKLLRNNGFKVSMSGKGNCYDRAIGRHWFKHNGEVRRRKLLQVAPSQPLLRNSLSGNGRPNWSGAGTGKPAARSRSPSSNTSTASTTLAANTRHSAGNHPWPSNERPPNMSKRPERNRCRSSPIGWCRPWCSLNLRNG